MKTQDIVNKALLGLDQVGYRLDDLGITDKVNRHTALAFVMAEQHHLRGEMDSLNAKIDQQKARVERIKKQAEALATAGFELASYPLKVAQNIINKPKAS